MGRLDEDGELTAQGEGFSASLAPDWRFFTPSGGFLAALALRAVGKRAAIRRPASLSCVFLSMPRFDEALSLEVVPLKANKRAEIFRVGVTQAGKAILEAHVWTAEETEGFTHDVAHAPAIAPPEQIPSMEELPEDHRLPPFPIWNNLEQRRPNWAGTHGVRSPRVHGWFKFRPADSFVDPFVDAGRPLILLDALVFGAGVAPHPGSDMIATTLDVHVHFHRSGWPASPWLHMELEVPIAEEGRFSGRGVIWDAAGRVVASGISQMICLGGSR